MRPSFVTFEGIDGSGKSSHLEVAAAWFTERAISARVTREPGGTAVGSALRAIFLDPAHDRLDGTVEMLIVFAARRQHLVEVIEPALASGSHVLCDRFTDSTLAYQGYGRGLSFEQIHEVDRLATGGRRPDRTLLFDLPAALARERRNPQGADRLDGEQVEFYERVRHGYLALAAAEPQRFRSIDSSGTRQETAAQVRRALADLLEDTQA